MAQPIGSLTGAISNIAGVKTALDQNQRLQETHDLEQQANQLKLEEAQHNYDRQQKEERVKDLLTTVNMGETFGWNDPRTQDYVRTTGSKYGIFGAAQQPDGTVVFLDQKGQPFRSSTGAPQPVTPGSTDETSQPVTQGPMGNVLALSREQRQNIMRLIQHGQRTATDLGNRELIDYPMRSLREETPKGPTPITPEQADYYKSGAYRNRKEGEYYGRSSGRGAQPKSEFTEKDLDAAIYRTFEDPDRSPGGAQPALGAKARDLARRLKAQGYDNYETWNIISAATALGPQGQPPPGAGGASPPPAGGAPSPPPGAATEPPPAPSQPSAPKEPQGVEIVSGIDEAIQAQKEPSTLQTVRGFFNLPGLESEQRQRESQQAHQREQELRDRLLRETGKTYEQVKLEDLLKTSLAHEKYYAANPGAFGDRLTAIRQRIQEIIRSLSAERVRAARLRQEPGGAGTVATAPGPTRQGSRRGGLVRAPYGGTVDELAGTEVPAGISTRVRRLAAANGGPGAGAGMSVRLTQGREF